ncbi:MAG TPA: sodium:proton antiporter [Lentisphaeria bacterium]|nr:MAG: sodium:proton antiporter [Lentisphaerae bacterium GWF2_38_69]HBM16635.1 sodium:proton antiporter [Lentisphaeria bacterium]
MSVGYKGIKRYWALLPFVVFLGTYLVTSLIINDFYKVPIAASVLLAAVVAIIMNHNEETNKKLDTFAQGAGNQTIIIMCIIFILAGVFGSVAKETGAVASTVNFALSVLPPQVLIPGIFLIACFISLAIGTSMGTIAALGPIAVGIAAHTSFPVALVLGAVLSGAMFGDGLSFIGDTTIAATRTQGCEMQDKFKMNFLIVLPAAIISFFVFYFVASLYQTSTAVGHDSYQLYKIIPYLVVIVISIFGVNVFITLITGIILSIAVGFIAHSFDIWQLLDVIQKGITSMMDLVLISAILGGIVEVIKYNGGIAQILGILRTNIKTKKGAELGIGLLVSLVDICTANNTVAIIVTGPLAKDIAKRYNIAPKRTASLIDIFSCAMQGIIPYGAQILLCVSFVGMNLLSPLTIMKYSYYSYLSGIFVILAVLLSWPGDEPWKWLDKFMNRFKKNKN